VSNKNPRTDQIEATKWPKGQTGNPKGKPSGPHLTTRLMRLIQEHGLGETIIKVWLGGALDQPSLLDTTEEYEETDKRGNVVTKKRRYRRKPNAALLGMLLDRIEGRIPDEKQTELAAELENLRKMAESLKKPRRPNRKPRTPKS
jgi:hypothetical protein